MARIALVTNSAELARFVNQVLTENGHTVHPITPGIDVNRLHDREAIDLLILDDVDAHPDAARATHSLYSPSGIPSIALFNRAYDGLTLVNANMVLTKPINPLELTAAVKRLTR